MPNITGRYLPTGLLDMVRDVYQKPSKFARGLLGPAYSTVKAIPEFLPGAGMFESQDYGRQALDQFRKNNYLAALGLLGTGMGTAALELVPGGAAATGTARVARRGARQQQPTMPSAMMREETGTGATLPSPPGMPVGAAGLSAKQQDKLEQAKLDYPLFGEASDYMLPIEIKPILNNPGGVEATERLLEIIPAAKNFAATAKAGTPKRGWYRASSKALFDVFGPDAPRFASLLAATSPQNSVEMNMLNSLNIWKNWTAAGRPTDPAAIKRVMGASVTGGRGEDSVLDAWVNNTVRALASPNPAQVTLSGPKVDSFYRNLVGDVERVTNDAHMSNFAGIQQDLLRVSPTEKALAEGNPGMTPAYAALSARARQGGQKIGYDPAEVQETVWSVAKPLVEKQAETGLRARDILQRGLLTPEEIRGTVDFSTLMNQGDYSNILGQAGYGDKLGALKPFNFPKRAPSLSLAEQNEMMRTAGRLENLADARLRESRAKSYQVGRVPERAYVFQTEEAIPGRVTGHLPNLLEASPTKQAAYTGRARSALTNPQGTDILHENLDMRTLKTRPMQGAYRSSPDAPIEFNPGFAAGVEVPLTKRKTIPRKEEQRLRTAATLRGGLLAQEGSPYSGLIPDTAGADAIVVRDKKLTPAEMTEFADRFGLEDVAAVDTGKGVGLLNWTGKPYTIEELDEIGQVLSPQSKPAGAARNVADPDMSYVDLSEEFANAPGSGAVTQRMVDELDKLSAKDFKKLDQPNVRIAARDLNKIDEARKKAGEPVREDLMRMREIVAEKGLTGLKEALKKGDFVPALAAIGLLPVLYEASGQVDETQPR